MKIKDLIKKLKEFDGDLEIMTNEEENYLEDFSCDFELTKIAEPKKRGFPAKSTLAIQEDFSSLYEKEYNIKEAVIIINNY